MTGSAYDDLEAQANALTRDCPRCSVEAGSGCVNPLTGQALRACHWQRIRPADLGVVVSTESDSLTS